MTDYLALRLGRVTVEGDHATITFERRLPHPPEVVWEAITETGQLSRWYLENPRIEGRVGGTVDFSSGPANITGRTLAWDPPRVFEHEWNVKFPGLPKGEHGVIRWELVNEGDETVLRLTHSRLTRQTATGFAPGIHALLDRLEAHLNKTPLPDWQKRRDEVRMSYPHWRS
jgi:uncharacterized protein YndB with AHSA1/START domain